MHVFKCFEFQKTRFYVFYLQVNVFNIYGENIAWADPGNFCKEAGLEQVADKGGCIKYRAAG